jgi:integrase
MGEKSVSYRDRSKRILEKDLLPKIGKRPIGDIKPPELLHVLKTIEARTVDIAHRANQLCGLVFNYAMFTGRLEHSPQTQLAKALKSRNVKHYAAITTPQELSKLLRAIECYQGLGIVKTALRLSVMLFQRPGEIRTMRWTEINWEKVRWERASTEQKSRREHLIPLARQAIELLKNIKTWTGKGEYVFPNARGRSRPMSDNAVRTALRTMGFDNDKITPHGFRAMARTILNEELGYRPDLIEMQIAHKVMDPMGRAYNRTEFLAERTSMMQAWADYLDHLAGVAVKK